MTSQDNKGELCRVASAESCITGLHASMHSLNASSGDDKNAEKESKKQEEEKEVSATKSGTGVHDDDMEDIFLFWN